VLILTALACRSPQQVPPPPAGPLLAFDLGEGAALFDAPFPGLHRLRDGRVDVHDWPNPDAIPYVDILLGLASEATGFGTTNGVMFRLQDPATPLRPPALADTLRPDSPAQLVALDGPRRGQRVPFDLTQSADGGPFGAPGLVTLLPLQGVPLSPETTYAAVLLRSLGEEPLGVPPSLWEASRGGRPSGWSDALASAYHEAFEALEALGVPREEIAGLSVFRTWDPTALQRQTVAQARELPPPAPPGPLTVSEVYDTFCVLESTVQMPVYQSGELPYTTGGAWEVGPDGNVAQQGTATSRLWLTVPRQPAPPGGYPVTVMIRTGGGGDRPLVDRGVRDAEGVVQEAGTGPALQLARAGHVGVQVDGPHGGPLRNPGGADEQFLMFNVTNPVATRDNVRQSALELALLPATLQGLSLDASGCPGAEPSVPLDTDELGLLGHSMGATIAPLVLAAAPEYQALVLSGAGGSYLYNLVYKQSPLEVRPLAESLLGFTARGRVLREDDAVLQLLQWVSEPADPPPYAALTSAHVLMVQGIVDTYILPPMANATSLSYGLDLAGPALDEGHPELEGMRTLQEVLAYGGGELASLPLSAEDEPLRAVLQVAEDGVEDGHEVLYQTEQARHAYRCFLWGFAHGQPLVPEPAGEAAPCD
jgi:hypothetical protein